jgi:2-methylcitrate dehydratase PrpD
MTTTRKFIEAIATIDDRRLTDADRSAARDLLLDHLGVVARGSQSDAAVIFRRYLDVAPSPGRGNLPLIGTKDSAPAVAAAMANAVAGHAIEFDDVHNGASSHPGVVVFPAAFAATALADANAEAFLLGVVAGYEAMCRIGRAANPPSEYARHFHPTGTTGVLGAAVAAATIFGLDVDNTVSAVGIAASMAAGSLQFLIDGAWTKPLHPAFAARNGLEAALLAREGYRGTDDGIAGTRAFLQSYSAQPNAELLLQGWGDMPLEIRNTSIKAHTCCRYNQGPIDAVLALRDAHDINAEDVRSVTIGVPSVAVDIVAEPVAAKRSPQSVVDAQFSLQFGVAVALLARRASLDEYTPSMVLSARVAELTARIEYEVDPDLDRSYPNQWRAWARIVTNDGRVLEHRVDDPKGDPTNPLTREELLEKFVHLTESVFPSEHGCAIVEAVASLGERTSFSDLVGLLDLGAGHDRRSDAPA